MTVYTFKRGCPSNHPSCSIDLILRSCLYNLYGLSCNKRCETKPVVFNKHSQINTFYGGAKIILEAS